MHIFHHGGDGQNLFRAFSCFVSRIYPTRQLLLRSTPRLQHFSKQELPLPVSFPIKKKVPDDVEYFITKRWPGVKSHGIGGSLPLMGTFDSSGEVKWVGVESLITPHQIGSNVLGPIPPPHQHHCLLLQAKHQLSMCALAAAVRQEEAAGGSPFNKVNPLLATPAPSEIYSFSQLWWSWPIQPIETLFHLQESSGAKQSCRMALLRPMSPGVFASRCATLRIW